MALKSLTTTKEEFMPNKDCPGSSRGRIARRFSQAAGHEREQAGACSGRAGNGHWQDRESPARHHFRAPRLAHFFSIGPEF